MVTALPALLASVDAAETGAWRLASGAKMMYEGPPASRPAAASAPPPTPTPAPIKSCTQEQIAALSFLLALVSSRDNDPRVVYEYVRVCVLTHILYLYTVLKHVFIVRVH